MKMIVAADRNWGIGKDGRLLAHLSGDLRYFKERTLGKTIIMGRTTLESLPGGRPLPGRTTFVMTRNADYETDCEKFGSVDSLLERLETVEGDVLVCGGADIYEQLMPYCDTFYITKIDAVFDADRFIPDLDGMRGVELLRESEEMEENGIKYRFLEYIRTGVPDETK